MHGRVALQASGGRQDGVPTALEPMHAVVARPQADTSSPGLRDFCDALATSTRLLLSSVLLAGATVRPLLLAGQPGATAAASDQHSVTQEKKRRWTFKEFPSIASSVLSEVSPSVGERPVPCALP